MISSVHGAFSLSINVHAQKTGLILELTKSLESFNVGLKKLSYKKYVY